MWKKLLCIITAAAVQLSFGALDWNITGSGARAAGMGNAFIGLADDATAINWNPGGLTALEHFEASVVGGAVLDAEDLELTDSYGLVTRTTSRINTFHSISSASHTR